MDFIPIAIFWVLAVIGLFGKRSLLVYLFFASMPFGSFAAIPTSITAGLTLTPTPLIACLLIGRTFLSAKSLRFATSAMFRPQALLLLTLFWLVAVAVTLLMPRIFEGIVLVTPMKMNFFMYKQYLHPSTQNFSQVVYLTISVFTVVAFACVVQEPKLQQVTLKGLCLGGTLTIVTGLLDSLAQYMPLGFILAPFRTASYSLMTEVSVSGGVHRVVGLMPEASAFGGVCLQFLILIYFTRHAIANNFVREKVVPIVASLLLLFTWLSTSSSALVTLIVLGVFGLLEWLWRAKSIRQGTKRGRELELEFWLVFVLAAILFVVYLVQPHAFDPFINLFDDMVLKKTKTLSYEERMFWNTTSWDALQSTYGMGVGMGGTRASNSIIATFSNTGYLGGMLYCAFVLQSALRRANPADVTNSAFASALRWSILPLSVSNILAGTSADFGLINAFLFGAIFSTALISWRQGAQTSSARPAKPAATTEVAGL